MDKLLICLLAFIGTVFNGFSQTADSLTNIKGYYVTRFLKDEISFSYNQKINKLNSEPYSIPIDYTRVSFFIPLDINNAIVNNSNDVAKVMSFENNLNKDSIYYLPVSKQIEKYIKRVFNLDLILSKEISIFSEVEKFSPYYIDTNSDKYLYKCMFINGKALKTTILNIEEKRYPLHLDAYSVNRKSQSIELFFIININSYSTIVDIEGLKEWVPYSEK